MELSPLLVAFVLLIVLAFFGAVLGKLGFAPRWGYVISVLILAAGLGAFVCGMIQCKSEIDWAKETSLLWTDAYVNKDEPAKAKAVAAMQRRFALSPSACMKHLEKYEEKFNEYGSEEVPRLLNYRLRAPFNILFDFGPIIGGFFMAALGVFCLVLTSRWKKEYNKRMESAPAALNSVGGGMNIFGYIVLLTILFCLPGIIAFAIWNWSYPP